MNSLNTVQNSEIAIDKLAAQMQIYSDAKRLLGIYLLLSIPFMVTLNVIAKPVLLSDIFDIGATFDLTNAIALFALFLTFIELIYLKPTVKNLKEKAAKIQEDFDCLVYGLEWNDILCGDRPCESEIATYSQKYTLKRRSRSVLHEWYTPDIGQLNKASSILLCQKENLGWDISQRNKFVTFINVLSLVALVLSIAVGLYLDLTLRSFILTVLIPCLPIVTFAISNHYDNKEAILDKQRLKSATEQVSTIQNPTIKYARNIQNLIFLNRSSNSLIFDWFYRYLKDSNQQGVTYASRQLVRRLLQ
ncbi:S-4TM family putative pore-forming effector [Vibrio harveyi]|uniref:S-4TM family putative pore-forming effector n=1 Tax=Vibrio harveyi TaxID=669 RepID=UPI003CEE03A5